MRKNGAASIRFNLPFVQAYADDICVFSNDFDTHVQHLLQVFCRNSTVLSSIAPESVSSLFYQ